MVIEDRHTEGKMRSIVWKVAGLSFFTIIGLFSCLASAPPVMFDGKMLYFPRDPSLSPVDISSFKFDFKNISDDKKFVEGKIFRFELGHRSHNRGRGGRRGAVQYAIFTKWLSEKIEVFYYTTTNLQAGEGSFLDCVPDGSHSDAYSCIIRGSPIGNTYRMMFKYFLFNSGQKIVLATDDRAIAYSEVVGEFPVPAAQTIP